MRKKLKIKVEKMVFDCIELWCVFFFRLTATSATEAAAKAATETTAIAAAETATEASAEATAVAAASETTKATKATCLN